MPDKLLTNSLLDENYDDLASRWSNGFFVWNRKDGPPIPIHVGEINRDENDERNFYLYCEYLDSGGSPAHARLNLVKESVIEAYPQKGIYNLYQPTEKWPVVVMFSRRIRRQWSHGVRRETCMMDVMHRDLYHSFGIPIPHSFQTDKLHFSLNDINDLFFPRFPEWKDALKLLDGAPSIALSRDFGLMNNFTGPGYYLFWQWKIVAEIEGSKIRIRENQTAQEILDLIKRRELPLKVELA